LPDKNHNDSFSSWARPEGTDFEVRKVEEIRTDIDRCDERLMSAFIERARLVREVARSKAKAGRPVLDAERERAMLDRAQLLGPNTRSFMNQVLALCRLEMYDEIEPKEHTNGNTT
jgi:chorismate mutase